MCHENLSAHLRRLPDPPCEMDARRVYLDANRNTATGGFLMEKFALQSGEQLLFREPVSLVTGRMATRTGVCYLTTQRIVIDSESLVAGSAAAVSIILRTLLRKTKVLGAQRQEIPFSKVGRISLGKYGIGRTVDIPLGDGSQVRMVLGKKATQRFFEALDGALAEQGWERVAEGEDSWRLRPKM